MNTIESQPTPATNATRSTNRPHLSVVSPIYGCRTCLVELHRRLVQSLEAIHPEFEIILVNDASPDDAWKEIRRLAALDPRVKGIDLARNFGQHYAITAGLDYAQGDWVVVMDCDLQDPPEEIPKLYAKAQEGFDGVFGRRHLRQDSWIRRIASKAFGRVLAYFWERPTDSAVANFSIISRRVAQYLRSVREVNRCYGLFVAWLGFNIGFVDVKHSPRFEGKTSYTFFKALGLAVDSIVAHSNKPLRLSIQLGFLVAALAMIVGLGLIVRYVVWAVPAEGWTSTLVSIYFIGGLLFVNLGVVGLYIGKVFDEVKGRPLYVVREELNIDEPAVARRLPPGAKRIDDDGHAGR